MWKTIQAVPEAGEPRAAADGAVRVGAPRAGQKEDGPKPPEQPQRDSSEDLGQVRKSSMAFLLKEHGRLGESRSWQECRAASGEGISQGQQLQLWGG